MDSVGEKILRYISDKDKNQALLLSGTWGIGKTYYIKHTLQDELEKNMCDKEYKVLYFSLSGVNSLDDLKSILGAKLLEDEFIKTDWLAKGKRFAASATSNIESLDINIFGVLGLSVGVSDIINLENLIDYSKVVLVFDDLERCSSIKLQELFGFINTFTEHKNIPVIVAANEDSLKDIEEYNIIKEKSIYRAIAFSSDLLDVYSKMVDKYLFDEKTRGFLINQFKIYLNQQEDLNLRDLKFFLNNWNNLYSIFKAELDESKEYYYFILEELYKYLFLRSIQYKHGKSYTPWEQSSQYGLILIDKDAEYSTPSYLQFTNGFKFIDDYVYGFSFNREDIKSGLDEVISKYEDQNLALFRLLNYNNFSEREVLSLLGTLLFELINGKYSQKDIKSILVILVQLRYSCGITFDIDYYVNSLAKLIINDEGLLSYHLKEASHYIELNIKSKYDKLSNRLIEIIERKEAEIDYNELYLKDKFYDLNVDPKSIKEFVITNKERYGQQESFIKFFGDKSELHKMIREFDNGRLIVLHDVLKWLYWYGSKKNVIDIDREALKDLVRYIEYQISLPFCDKIRAKNLIYFRNTLKQYIDY